MKLGTQILMNVLEESESNFGASFIRLGQIYPLVRSAPKLWGFLALWTMVRVWCLSHLSSTVVRHLQEEISPAPSPRHFWIRDRSSQRATQHQSVR